MSKNKIIPYGRQVISASDIQAVIETLESDFLTCGPAISKFEQKLCEVTGASFAIACSSGTAALHLCALALDFGPQDFGLSSPLTFVASTNCFEYCGASSDFVDISLESLCISPEAVRKRCETGNIPRAVVAVDFAGVPAALPELYELSKQYKFKLIEDAAHSLGSTYSYKGRELQAASCVHSDLAILSFHPVKNITTAEGGAITTNDASLAERLRLLRSHGIVRDIESKSALDGLWYHEMQMLGFHYRLTDVQAALGISQLQNLSYFKKQRQQLVQRYTEAFADDSRFITPPWPAETSPCFHLYPLQFSAGSETRLNVYQQLKSRGIHAQVHYIPVYWQPYYQSKYAYARGKCPNAELYYSRCLSLPLYPSLSLEEQTLVIDSIKEIAN